MRGRRWKGEDATRPMLETAEARGSRLADWLESARWELSDNWDTDLAIVLGVIVGVLGIFQVTSLEITVGMILVALAAVAGSLHRDRSLRDELKGAVDRLDSKLVIVSRALSSPLPYEVVAGHYKWDFQPGGQVAKVTKRARVRFVHNGIWTILQWHSMGIHVQDLVAHRLGDQGPKQLNVLTGPDDPPNQRFGKLIAFDRECRQNEVLDFEYRYESHGSFDREREWIRTDIETSTTDLTIELVWADDRYPRSISRIDDGERTPLPTEESGGRHRTKLKLQRLTRGQKLLIEWDWLPMKDLAGNS